MKDKLGWFGGGSGRGGAVLKERVEKLPISSIEGVTGKRKSRG